MAITRFLVPPEQIFNRGRDHMSRLGQLIAEIDEWADTYELRIGLEYFEQFKVVAPEGQELTPEQVDFNAEIDWLAARTLDMVELKNRLFDSFVKPENMAVIGQMRTDI